jgi:hypothetical protein
MRDIGRWLSLHRHISNPSWLSGAPANSVRSMGELQQPQDRLAPAERALLEDEALMKRLRELDDALKRKQDESAQDQQ